MTFEEWLESTGQYIRAKPQTIAAMRTAWHAGFYQGRLHEGGKNIARQIDDEILGHLKAAQEAE